MCKNKKGDENMKKNRFMISIVVDVVFLLLFLIYVGLKLNFGVYPLGMILGSVVLIQLILLILNIKDSLISKDKDKYIYIISIVINILSIIIAGYYFLIWIVIAS